MTAATITFIPHGGGPLPLMDEPSHVELIHFLKSYSERIPRPDAIVVVSAHWEEESIRITSASKPELLFDYHNFPPHTYEYEYAAAGEPDLARRMQSMLKQSGIDAKLDADRGLDHGVFVPLMLMYPDADIPCLQISLSSSLDAMEHIQIGRALAELKHENLLIIGSGFSFHNMRAFMEKSDDSIDLQNREFEDWLQNVCCDKKVSEDARSSKLADWALAPHARYCHPREEHLLPLHVCYGIAQTPASVVFNGKVNGFLTKAYQW